MPIGARSGMICRWMKPAPNGRVPVKSSRGCPTRRAGLHNLCQVEAFLLLRASYIAGKRSSVTRDGLTTLYDYTSTAVWASPIIKELVCYVSCLVGI